MDVPEPGKDKDGRRGAYKVAYDEAIRGLEEQQAVVNNLGTRAGVLISGAAIATSFLGGQALTDGSATCWSWVAIGCFGGLAVMTLIILAPRRSLALTSSAALVDALDNDPTLDDQQVHRDLAVLLEEAFDRTQSRIRRLSLAFGVASLLLVLEIAAWVVDLA